MSKLGIQQGTGIPLDDESKHPATYKGGKLLLSPTSCYNPGKWYEKKCSDCPFNIDCCYPKKRGGIKYIQWSDGSWHVSSDKEVHTKVIRQPVVHQQPTTVIRTPVLINKAPVIRTPIMNKR